MLKVTDTDRRRLGKWLIVQLGDAEAAREEYRYLRDTYGEMALIKAYKTSRASSLSGFRKSVVVECNKLKI